MGRDCGAGYDGEDGRVPDECQGDERVLSVLENQTAPEKSMHHRLHSGASSYHECGCGVHLTRPAAAPPVLGHRARRRHAEGHAADAEVVEGDERWKRWLEGVVYQAEES